MDPDKLKTLRLLEAIEAGDATTQRKLADNLNISLGLVNAFLKRLARKGYVKISTIPKNRVRYLLTPKGLREKSRLTCEYIHYSIEFYKDIKEVMVNLFSGLQAEGVQRIALYGCGEIAELACLFLQNTDITLAGVFDEHSDGHRFYGHPVQGRDALASGKFEYILLTQTTDIRRHHDLVVQNGVSPECILYLGKHAG